MKYSWASENVVICENYLPEHMIDGLYTDFTKYKDKFNIPQWSNTDTGTQFNEQQSHKCNGLDFWINHQNLDEFKDSTIVSLDKWFFHQGLYYFIEQTKQNSIFSFLNRKKFKWTIHIIRYNKGGYYNWHYDIGEDSIFTFNLVLQKSKKLQGGHQLFMDGDGDTIEVDTPHNILSVFPSYIPHAVTPIEADDEVQFDMERFSLQYWVSLE